MEAIHPHVAAGQPRPSTPQRFLRSERVPRLVASERVPRLGASEVARPGVSCLPLQEVTSAMAKSYGLLSQESLQAHRSHRPSARDLQGRDLHGRDPAPAGRLNITSARGGYAGQPTPSSTHRDINPPTTRRSLVSMASQWEHYKQPASQRSIPTSQRSIPATPTYKTTPSYKTTPPFKGRLDLYSA